MRFTDAHSSSSVCSPTRYSLLTGRYHWRTRLQNGVLGGFSRPLIAPDRTTLAGLLHQAGYHTACFGKWHLGDLREHWPEQQGFDLNLGGCGKGTPPSYFSPYQLPNLPDGPDGKPNIQWSPYTSQFNLTRHPAATVPCGLSSEGLPVGLQIVSGHYRDALVLSAAARYAEAHPLKFPVLPETNR